MHRALNQIPPQSLFFSTALRSRWNLLFLELESRICGICILYFCISISVSLFLSVYRFFFCKHLIKIHLYLSLHLGIWGTQLCLEWESCGAWQLACSATLTCWVWSGRGANVPHELGIKFRHKMPKSAPDFTLFPGRASTHAAYAHVNNKSIWKIARKHAARAKKCRP